MFTDHIVRKPLSARLEAWPWWSLSVPPPDPVSPGQTQTLQARWAVSPPNQEMQSPEISQILHLRNKSGNFQFSFYSFCLLPYWGELPQPRMYPGVSHWPAHLGEFLLLTFSTLFTFPAQALTESLTAEAALQNIFSFVFQNMSQNINPLTIHHYHNIQANCLLYLTW